MKYLDKSIAEIANKIKKQEVTAVEVVQESLSRIEELNPQFNAFVTMNEKALDDAKAIDERIDKGEDVGLMAGIPVGLKDLFCKKGLKTTACSKILENFVPPYDSTVTQNLEKQGAVVIGKLNCDEFAMGSSNENSLFGPSRNPWDKDRVPGGSSGGSAAAISARMCLASTGTDTGGSIRQPASFCGIVGIKPTYGRVSRYGVVAFASSLDQPGPMTKSVEDAAIMLESMAGHDVKDSTSLNRPVPKWSESINLNISGKTIGLPKEYFQEELDANIKSVIQNAVEVLKSQGAKVKEISLPLTRYSVPVYYLVASSEASSNLARYDGIRYGYRHSSKDLETLYKKTRNEGFSKEVKRRIMLGTFALSSGYYDAYYNKASQVRRMILDDFNKAFAECDVIASPVTTSTAFKLGERIEDPIEMYFNDIFTTSASLAGLPGMSVPVGFDQGLPVGLQLLAPHFEEQRLFDFGKCAEQNIFLEKRFPDGL